MTLAISKLLARIARRDIAIAFNRPSDLITALCFFVISSGLLAIGLGPNSDFLREVGSGVIWVSALLSSVLSLGGLFASDERDGVMEQLFLSSHPLTLAILAKIFAHWLTTGLPVVLVSPLIGLLFGFSVEDLTILVISLLLGTPVLSLLGSIGAALTIGVRGATALVGLLILPLYVPVLIFGSLAVNVSSSGTQAGANLSFLIGILLISVAAFAFYWFSPVPLP